MARVHLRASTGAETRCGLPIESPAWTGGALPAVDAVDAATCRRCLRAVLDDAAPVAAFVASGPYLAAYGARELGRVGARAIERSRRGEAPAGRGWPTAEAAVRSYVRACAEGASLRSTSDPDRAHRVQLSRDPSLGGREHAAVDCHRTVAVALSRATSDAAALAHACPVLTPEQCLDAYVLRTMGRATQKATRAGGRDLKGRYIDWIGLTAEDAAREAAERYGAAVTARHVALIVRHFSGRVRDALVSTGEMRAPPPKVEDAAGRWDPLARLREAGG